MTDPDLFQGCLTDAVCSGADAEVAAAWFVTNPEPKVVLIVEEPTTIEQCYIAGGVVMNLENNAVDCPANCPQRGTIWGTDTYTDDSAVCTATVHAGLIDNDVGGTVTVNPEPGQDSYHWAFYAVLDWVTDSVSRQFATLVTSSPVAMLPPLTR